MQRTCGLRQGTESGRAGRCAGARRPQIDGGHGHVAAVSQRECKLTFPPMRCMRAAFNAGGSLQCRLPLPHLPARVRKRGATRPVQGGHSDEDTLHHYSVHVKLVQYRLHGTKSISTNGVNRPTQRPRVHNVWCCHWLSKRRAKTKQITSQTWACLDVSGGGPLL